MVKIGLTRSGAKLWERGFVSQAVGSTELRVEVTRWRLSA